ncbi:MAG: cytochrome c oxidase subunit 3 [Solirubrobacteraceae bacterium]
MSDSLVTVPESGPELNGRAPELAKTEKHTHLPGEPGTWVFILGDMTVFALLFGVFVYYRGKQPHLFLTSQGDLHRTFGAINTLLLLTSSLMVITAVRAIRAKMRRLAPAAISVALICGIGFLTNKVLEWSDLLSHHHKPATNNFFMYFFVLTGIHAFHLIIGMGVLITLFVLSRKETLSKGQFAFVEGGACFWHMVDLLWIVLFAILYLMH